MLQPAESALSIVFLDRASIPAQIEYPPLPFEHQWTDYDQTTKGQVVERLKGAAIAITNKVVLDRESLSQLPDLKLIVVAATGFNNIDVSFCKERGIAVTNVQGYSTPSVPEHVIAMMFALKRNLKGYHNDIAAGEWQRTEHFCFFTHPISDVTGSTLGVIGSGAIGQATAGMAKALGMNVVFAERKGVKNCRAGYLPLQHVIEMSDVLTLHCPLNEQTHHIIGREELLAMKKTCVLINTGRGGLVDEETLVDALKQGQIAGAGVDVFSQEPADISNPLIANMDLANLLLTPHVAWGSESSFPKIAETLASNIVAFVQGRQQNRIV
ncbi:D-2-hydroxyacid dehydrogenase [Vibrio pectenicida]|uniref:D-2-hydroxyacid dehydrogenase n=1 Tax=Vibrio pectenicida TaxID=62763 RepID=A0A427U794_9VIBR|nr:D-2-hydroxyacid dehydrogenase [Vibrio pectenicida]RSD32382.1 D-2-hydroxyacid dehydrogenase [Vibrio pectenicida]